MAPITNDVFDEINLLWGLKKIANCGNDILF